ncbi:MAG: L,D-transpeptidase family protein [Christensenella sp.]|nr:L,D-transpeptidase family protein [Christensenella sp.]
MQKQFIKKIICIVVVCALAALSVVGCGAKGRNEAASPSPSLTPSLTPAATASPIASPTPEASASPTPAPTMEQLAEGVSSGNVKKLQKRLMELGYMAEKEATDYYGSTTRIAVSNFQRQNNLNSDGIAGEQTLRAVYADDAKACEPFSNLAPTVGMTFEELVMTDDGTRDKYPEGYPKAGTYKIIVDIEHQVTMVYSKDEDGEYTVPVRYMLCSTGKNDCTPKGTFKMDNYRVRFSQFVRDKTYGQYWTQIRGAIYFHTILYSEFDTSTYIEEVWDKIGTADSHGCIRLTVPDAKWMWYHIAPGTECVIRDGDENDEETAAIRAQLALADAPEERLNTEPEDIPYTDNWQISDIPIEVPFVQGSQN